MERSRSYIAWKWPILTKIKNYYKAHGLKRTILWLLIIIIGLKIVVLNIFIFIVNALFSISINQAPVLNYFLGN
jgi:hypothetical protein